MQTRHTQRTFDRVHAFLERRMGDGILATIRTAGPPSEPEQARVRPCLLMENPDRCVELGREVIEGHRACASDAYPSVYPALWFGESLWSAIMGAPIGFSGTSTQTWSHCAEPPIGDLAAFDFPAIQPDNPWLQRMLEANRLFVERLGPACDYTPFIFMDCLNLLVELRGAMAAYLDLYDQPERVARFMDWSVEVNMAVYDAQAAILRPAAEQAFAGHPLARYSATRIPNLSIDAYGLTAPEVYDRYGLEQHTRIVERYGGGRLHIHGNGRHLCERVARNRNLTSCYMGDDPGVPPAWTVVEELKRRMTPVPISVSIPRAEFDRGLAERTLPGGVQYLVTASGVAEAADLTARAIEYRAR